MDKRISKKINIKKSKTLIISLMLVLGALLGILELMEGLEQETDINLPDYSVVDSEQESLSSTYDLSGRPEDKLYFVTEVIDGDTIKVRGNMRVRLIGIDSPEGGECYYEEAAVALDELIGERYVRLQRDTEAVDEHGRLLRYVFLPSGDLMENDIFANEYMLRYGYAEIFPESLNKKYASNFTAAREEAYTQRRGLWGECDDYLSEYEEDTQDRERHELPTDPNCTIKGNISKRGIGKTYSFPGCSNYSQVKIDTRKGEQYFCTEEEAQAAGFNRSGNCP